MSGAEGEQEQGGKGGGFFTNLFSRLASFKNIFASPAAQKKIIEIKKNMNWKDQTRDIWRRKFELLPLCTDLPRLASRITIEDHRSLAEDELLPRDPHEGSLSDGLLQSRHIPTRPSHRFVEQRSLRRRACT